MAQLRSVAFLFVLSHVLVVSISCSPTTNSPPSSREAPGSVTDAQRIIGSWKNLDKCLIREMVFSPDGTVVYNPKEDNPTLGTWRFVDSNTLELAPQPLFVLTPAPRGRIQVSFHGKGLIINEDGPRGGWFQRTDGEGSAP
jgi:hypothetical protein